MTLNHDGMTAAAAVAAATVMLLGAWCAAAAVAMRRAHHLGPRAPLLLPTPLCALGCITSRRI